VRGRTDVTSSAEPAAWFTIGGYDDDTLVRSATGPAALGAAS
jgi:hypothetical protein